MIYSLFILLCLLLWYPGEKKNSLAGSDTLNISGSVSKSKQKDPFSKVTERSVVSPTPANFVLGIQTPSGPEKEWATASVKSDGKTPFLPSRLWEWPFSSPGVPQLFLARLLLHPLHAFVHLVLSPLCLLAKNNHLLYMILELISLLLIRTSSSLSLAFICLYSLYSSAIGVRSSFCTFLVGVKADREDFSNGRRSFLSSFSPPPKQDLQRSSFPPLSIREQTKNFYPPRGEKKEIKKRGKLLQESHGHLHSEAEHSPMVPNAKPMWSMPYLSEIASL